MCIRDRSTGGLQLLSMGCGSSTQPNGGKAIKVLHYNIYVGQGCDAEHGGADLSKLSKLAEFLRQQDADVVGLCECNGWQDWDETSIKNALGYPHAVFRHASKTTRAHVMILSKHPIQEMKHPELQDVFFHALLHIKTCGVHVIETHLSPRNSDSRLKEINAFMGIVEEHAAEPFLLMGDMNSIMPSSRDSYDEAEIITSMRAARGGKPIGRHCRDGPLLDSGDKKLDDDWEIDYRPLEVVSQHMMEVCPTKEMFTYPTTYRDDQQQDPKLRIDGVFANKALLDGHKAVLDIMHNPECEDMSDHYPCMVTLTPLSK
eukprot:TRINITY_DN10859_c0_g1_i10.p2 TRINITY_DN10859_c0_g1~~TRINITY_DN10859_c0_g1_i10.p2  ORF type:complete len:316 (+),score=101.63 TRINITY_DN10859_c0_g1_i10:162-1109(+)